MAEKKVASRQERLIFEKIIRDDMQNPIQRKNPNIFPTPQNSQNYVPTPMNNQGEYPIQDNNIPNHTPIPNKQQTPKQRLINIKRNIGKRDAVWEEKRRIKMQLVDNIMNNNSNNNTNEQNQGDMMRPQDNIQRQPMYNDNIPPERSPIEPIRKTPMNQMYPERSPINPNIQPQPGYIQQQRTPMNQPGYTPQQRTPLNNRMPQPGYTPQQRTPMNQPGYMPQQRTPMPQPGYPQQQRTPMNIPNQMQPGYTPQQRTPMYPNQIPQQRTPYNNPNIPNQPTRGYTPQYQPRSPYSQNNPNYIPTPQRNVMSPNQQPLRSPYANYPSNGIEQRGPTPMQQPNMNQQIRTPYQQYPSRTPAPMSHTMQTPYNQNSMRNARTPFDYKPTNSFYGQNRIESGSNFQISNRPPSRPFGNVSFKGTNRGGQMEPYYYERENINSNYPNPTQREQYY